MENLALPNHHGDREDHVDQRDQPSPEPVADPTKARPKAKAGRSGKVVPENLIKEIRRENPKDFARLKDLPKASPKVPKLDPRTN